MWILWLIIGMMIGGFLGVVMMCLFQINKDEDIPPRKIEQIPKQTEEIEIKK